MDPNSGLAGGSERTLGADSASIVGNFIPPRGYALSGKIMLSAIIVLFAVVLLLFALHLYIRWHLHRLALLRRRRRARRPLVFASDVRSAAAAPRGLDPKTLESIPVLSYRTEGYDGEEAVVECSVCLCEFGEGERLRRLPICGHRFHVECIDMWFHSHATCPLCRVAVEAANQPAAADEVPPMSPSDSCPLCGRAENGTGSSSSGVPEVRINVHSGGEEESKSTAGAMGALRRMLSAPPEEGAAAAAAAEAELPV